MVLRRERLKLFEVVGENVVNVTLRSVQPVPAGKPDVQKILSIVNVTVSATGTPLPNKVVVEGTATVQTIYVAALPDQPVHHMEHTISFLQFVDVPGAQPGMTVLVRPRVTFSDIVIRAPREVEIELIIELFVKVTMLVQLDVVTDVMFKSIPVKVDKQLVRAERVIGENTGQVILSNVLPVPPGKPPVQKILSIISTEVLPTEVRVIPDLVIIQGQVRTQILYVAAQPDQPVHQMHQTVNFLVTIRIPGAMPGLMVEIFPTVEFARATVVDPMTIMQDLIINVFAKVTEIQQLRIVTDVRSDRIPINVIWQLVAIEDVVNEVTQQVNVRQETTIPQAKPPAAKIIEVFSSAVQITRADILDGKVIIEGTLVLQVIYVAAQPDQPVHHTHLEIPFTTFVELPGAFPGMNLLVRPRVEFASVQLLPVGVTPPPTIGTRDILVDAIIELFVKVTKTVQKRVVTDVLVPEEFRDMN
ncbi:MAG: DUF3794 domain-containing protein [Bacillota bacterium]